MAGQVVELVEYVINLGGDVNEKSKETAKSVSSFADAARAGLNAAGALSAGLLALGASYKSLADDVYATIDGLNTMSAATGLSTETMAGLRLAAKASNKELADIIPENLSKKILDAANGIKKAKLAFAELGVEAVDANGHVRDTDVVFREVLTQLGKVEDPTLKAGLAFQILGKQGKELLTAFDDVAGLERFVASAQEFGINAGPEAVAASNAWWSATANLSLAWDDLKVQILDAAGPADELVNNLAVGMVYVTTLVAELSDEVGRVANLWWEMTTGDIPGTVEALKEIKDEGFNIGDAFDDAYERAKRFWELNIRSAGEARIEFGKTFATVDDLVEGAAGFGLLGDPTAQPGLVDPDDLRDPKPPKPASTKDPAVEAAVKYLDEVAKVRKGEADYQRKKFDEGVALAVDAFDSMLVVHEENLAEAVQGPGVGGSLLGAVVGGLTGLVGDVADTLHDLPSMITDLFADVRGFVTDIVDVPSEIVGEVLPAIIEQIPELLIDIITIAPTLIVSVLEAAFATLLTVEFWIGVGKALVDAVLEVLNPFKGKEGNILGTNLKGENKKLFGLELPKFREGSPRLRSGGLAWLDDGERVLNPRETARYERGVSNTSVGDVYIMGAESPRDMAVRWQRSLGPYGLNLSIDALTG